MHDPDRPKSGGRKAYVPDGASSDRAAMMAKWGTRAKALFAATPKKVATVAAPKAAQAAPAASAPSAGVSAPHAAPTRPAASARPVAAPAAAKPWASYPQTADGAFDYFCSLLGEPYEGAKHEEKWFELFDAAAQGKDPDEFDAADVQRLFQTIKDGMAG